MSSIEDTLIRIRSRIPYDVFCSVDKIIRNRLIDSIDILKFAPTDHFIKLYTMDIQYVEIPDENDPNFVELAPGRQYIMNVCVPLEFAHIKRHPILHEHVVTYVGRDMYYNKDESHIFMSDQTCFEIYTNIGTKDDLDAIVYMRKICKFIIDKEACNASRMKMCISPKMYSIRLKDLSQ
jgi:hypothetical protein